MTSLFVYGTLRSPVGGPDSDTHYHDRIAAHIVSAEPATLDGARLFDLGSYPGLGRGVGQVVGELFEVDASVLDITDDIEGHPEFYVRRIETVTSADGNSRAAWAYWAPPDLLVAARVIASGDWFDRSREPVPSSIDAQLRSDRERLQQLEDDRE